MLQKFCVDPHFADRKLHFFEFLDLDRSRQIAPAHRKKWDLHLRGQNGGQPSARALVSQNADRVFGFVSREKKRQALDMVPVRVSEQQCQIDRCGSEFVFQGKAQLANSGAGVEHDNFAIRANLDTGGVSTVTDCRWAGNGNRSAHSPEFQTRRWRRKLQGTRMFGTQFSSWTRSALDRG